MRQQNAQGQSTYRGFHGYRAAPTHTIKHYVANLDTCTQGKGMCLARTTQKSNGDAKGRDIASQTKLSRSHRARPQGSSTTFSCLHPWATGLGKSSFKGSTYDM